MHDFTIRSLQKLENAVVICNSSPEEKRDKSVQAKYCFCSLSSFLCLPTRALTIKQLVVLYYFDLITTPGLLLCLDYCALGSGSTFT